jgi:hypothetical protein
VDGWDLAYLKFCCKVQGIRNELFANDVCKVEHDDDLSVNKTELMLVVITMVLLNTAANSHLLVRSLAMMIVIIKTDDDFS